MKIFSKLASLVGLTLGLAATTASAAIGVGVQPVVISSGVVYGSAQKTMKTDVQNFKYDSVTKLLTIKKASTTYEVSGGSLVARNIPDALVATDANAVLVSTTVNLAASNIGGLLPVSKGGTGTSSPGLVAGTNITSITGTWPNQTINASGSGGGGDVYLASTQTLTGQNTFINKVTISTAVAGVTRIEFADGTVQVTSPPVSGTSLVPFYETETVVLTAGTSWAGAQITGSSITVEVIGAGGAGGLSVDGINPGGGGGEYCRKSIAYTSGSVISYTIGQGGTGSGTDTTFNSTAVVGKGGTAGNSGGAGGTGGTGDVCYAGGAGGTPNTAGGGTGGGGAGGPGGTGKAGGAAGPGNGTGGGGAGGGTAGAQDTLPAGGVGGNGPLGSGGGAGATASVRATTGTILTGGGGGGGFYPTYLDGAPGGTGADLTASVGSGGGGGGSALAGNGGTGGLYGGGGGASASGVAGGNGANGVIVITYYSTNPISLANGVVATDSSGDMHVYPEAMSISNNVPTFNSGGVFPSSPTLNYISNSSFSSYPAFPILISSSGYVTPSLLNYVFGPTDGTRAVEIRGYPSNNFNGVFRVAGDDSLVGTTDGLNGILVQMDANRVNSTVAGLNMDIYGHNTNDITYGTWIKSQGIQISYGDYLMAWGSGVNYGGFFQAQNGTQNHAIRIDAGDFDLNGSSPTAGSMVVGTNANNVPQWSNTIASATISDLTASLPVQTDSNKKLVSAKISMSTATVGILAVANGGTGTATPSITAGTNITSVTGTWPNVTINAATQAGSGGSSSLEVMVDGVRLSSPTATVSLIAGSNITLTPSLVGGTTAQITVAATGGGISLTDLSASQPIVYNNLTGAFSATPISLSTGTVGTLQAAQMPALTGDITTAGASLATTLASVVTANQFGSSTVVPVITYDAKGRITAVSSATITGGSGDNFGNHLATKTITANYGATISTLTVSNTVTISSVATITALVLGTTSFVHSSSSTINPDATMGNNISITLTSSATINVPINAQDFEMFRYRIAQDAAGSRSITLGSGFAFGTDVSSATFSTAASKVDYLSCIYYSATSKCHIVAPVIRGY